MGYPTVGLVAVRFPNCQLASLQVDCQLENCDLCKLGGKQIWEIATIESLSDGGVIFLCIIMFTINSNNNINIVVTQGSLFFVI